MDEWLTKLSDALEERYKAGCGETIGSYWGFKINEIIMV